MHSPQKKFFTILICIEIHQKHNFIESRYHRRHLGRKNRNWFLEGYCYNHTKSNALHALDFYCVFVNKESENHQRLFFHDNIRDWEVLEWRKTQSALRVLGGCIWCDCSSRLLKTSFLPEIHDLPIP